MKFDVETYLGAVTRSVETLKRQGEPMRAVTLSRSYATTAEDLWDAIVNPERSRRWFLPISGDLKLGGHYQLEGNAGGTIERCEPPRHLYVTWEFGGGVSWVELRLEPKGQEAELTLVHICPINDHWTKFGPGAVGIGWDLGLLGLVGYLAGTPFDEATFSASSEGKAYMRGSAEGWRRADIASGEAESRATHAARQTAAFYTGETAEGA